MDNLEIIEKLSDDKLTGRFLHGLSLFIPGFFYIYISDVTLFNNLEFTKLIILSIIYSLPGYFISRTILNSKGLRKIQNHFDTKINDLISETSSDQQVRMVEKLKVNFLHMTLTISIFMNLYTNYLINKGKLDILGYHIGLIFAALFVRLMISHESKKV